MMFDTVAVSLPNLRAGKTRALAVAAPLPIATLVIRHTKICEAMKMASDKNHAMSV